MVGAFVTFTVAGSAFEARLALEATNRGWTYCEEGVSNWIRPADSDNVCLARITQLGVAKAYTEISATTYLYTIFEPSVFQNYDTGTHFGTGLGWTGNGNPIYWAGRSENDVAKNFTFEGWIDENCIFGNVKPDSTIVGATAFPIFFCVIKGFDGVNCLVGLDMLPLGGAYRCNARLIYATDSLKYYMGLGSGGFGVWGFDGSKARLSKLYLIRGGTLVADVVNSAAIIGSFEDVNGIPYVLCSKSQGVEVYKDECILTIDSKDYYYRCLYPVLTPPHTIMLCNKSSNFNATAIPASKGVDEIITYWVRCNVPP